MSRASVTLANSKLSGPGRPRKSTGKSMEVNGSPATASALPATEFGADSCVPTRLARSKLKDKLLVLYHNANCLTGVPILNWPETVLVYLLLLGLTALTALGAYKQIAKLGGGLGALGGGAGLLAAAAGR